MNKLEQLAAMSEVVADTGDIAAIEKYKPIDATTNPSLLLQASRLPQYGDLISKVVSDARTIASSDDEIALICTERFAVAIGLEILKLVPGRVSTEIDARLSFDSKASVESARRLVRLYEQNGVERERILIKLAATWEGILACRQLESEGINCNVTLVFSTIQAIAAAQASAYLISPFVGRILDWYKKNEGEQDYAPEENPGVLSVRRIYSCFKHRGYATVVMGASFRSAGEIEALAGCDRLTIAPKFLEQLSMDNGELTKRIHANPEGAAMEGDYDQESGFRYALNADAMATEKLAEGIRGFIVDQELLEEFFKMKIKGASA